MVGQNNL